MEFESLAIGFLVGILIPVAPVIIRTLMKEYGKLKEDN